MRLVHYSAAPLGPLVVIEQGGDTFKPHGLWVSDDNCEDNWPAWCIGENFGLGNLMFGHDVELASDANVLILRSVADIDAFTKRWAIHPVPEIKLNMWIDWEGVRRLYDGLIVTPYIWERRLSYGENDAMWYYSWDCASGCFWDPKAIASVRLRTLA